jgi:serine/threonine protein kinase/cytochrome c-type biogenesis protein CcmH/NrfG
MIGETISHYKILEKLGEGGMGVVYKAEDTKLKRTVALKFLSTDLTRDADAKERFIHEAQAASALDHPNICTIHEIDDTRDEQLFIVMAYYKGNTLRHKIDQGPLPLEDAVDIAVEVARGLGRAHEAGIVHRDVKPGNIMITERGDVKILDFGLAKLAGQARLTRTGSTLGTAAYMSPEQAQGADVDERTNIWSLGVMLFEMLTGELPFRGDHEVALLYSIVHENPRALSSLKHDLPAPVSSVICRVLQKDPALRYQTADELIADLKTLAKPSVTAPRAEKSIVVLPFDNLSPDPDQEYFSDGLTEEVISDLSNIHVLRVISRSSAMTFKGTKKKVPEIARELDVQYVLEGSVRKAGQSLRITAQLIDAANDAHLWAEKYSGTMQDVFDVQEKVSRAIVAALKLKLTPEESRKIAERPIDNVAAYQCYLRANADIWRFTESSVDSARLHLQRGLDILGENALLYSAMAFVYWQYVNIGAAQEEYIEKAEEYAQKALTLDPDSPQANYVVGMIRAAFYGDVKEALRRFKKTLAVNPHHPDAMKILAIFIIMSIGKLAAATRLMQSHKQIDPLDPWNYLLQGLFYSFDGQYKAAHEEIRRYYDTDPDNPMAQFQYAWALTQNEKLDEAFAIIDRSAKTTPDNACTKFGLLLKHGLLKEKTEALEIITPDFERTCRRDHHWSYFVTLGLALADAKNEAMDWLENAVNMGFINDPDLSRNPYLDNLRGEERFKKLLERVKVEWEQFEV